MSGIALRQIRAVIAVCEEGSFTRAAERENATQSGISQHVAAVERTLGVKLFERSPAGVVPTPAGMRYYRRCVEAVGTLETADEEMRALGGQVTGDLRIGLMPTFTRAVLAPTLDYFVPRYPDVRLHIVEGYSGVLTEMVRGDDLDFAIVPTFEGQVGLKSRLLVRDREMLMSGRARGLTAARAGPPVRVRAAQDRGAGTAQHPPAQSRDLFPDQRRGGRRDARDGRHDRHAGIRRLHRLGDVLPSVISRERHRPAATSWSTRSSTRRSISSCVVIQPARRTLTIQARLFLERFEAEVAHIHDVWEQALENGAVKPRAQATAASG